MKNRYGFTLIEMLGTIVILGVLGTIAVAGVTKYLKQSRQKAYDMLKDAAYEAVSNCASESNCILSDNAEFTVAELIEKGYLDSFKNPKNSSEECTGKVVVKVKSATGTGKITESNTGDCESGNCINGNKKVEVDEAYSSYLYKVTVNCSGFTNQDPSYYPKGTTETDWK